MKGCELCGHPAKVYCESDEASLCFECDSKVHRANFLVAKHCRSLLCHVCQAPTPWKASGPRFGPTVSVCEACADSCDDEVQRKFAEGDEKIRMRNGESEEYDDPQETDSDDEYGESTELGDEASEEENAENQVVPWSSTSTNSTTTSAFETSVARPVSSRKRTIVDAKMVSESSSGCDSPQLNYDSVSMARSHLTSRNDEATSSSSSRPIKLSRRNAEITQSERGQNVNAADFNAAEIITSLKRLQKNTISSEDDASEVIRGISRINKC